MPVHSSHYDLFPSRIRTCCLPDIFRTNTSSRADKCPYYSFFWHKVQQQKMAGPARFITNSLLQLPKGTQFSRYTHLFWTFFISGLIHALTDLGRGLPWEQSGAIQFFTTQVVGIVTEDVVKRVCRPLSGTKNDGLTAGLLKGIGYVWVVAFLVWSTPVWIYPSLYTDKGERKDQIIPYSVVGLLQQKWESK